MRSGTYAGHRRSPNTVASIVQGCTPREWQALAPAPNCFAAEAKLPSAKIEGVSKVDDPGAAAASAGPFLSAAQQVRAGGQSYGCESHRADVPASFLLRANKAIDEAPLLHFEMDGQRCGFASGSSCASSGHSLSTTARISLEMTVTFSISSMYLCNRRKSAGVMILPPTTRGE